MTTEDDDTDALLRRALGGVAPAPRDEARRAAARFLASAGERPSRARRLAPFAIAAALLLAGPIATRVLRGGGSGEGVLAPSGPSPSDRPERSVAAGDAKSKGLPPNAVAPLVNQDPMGGPPTVRIGPAAAAGGALAAIAAGVITGSAYFGAPSPAAPPEAAPAGASAAEARAQAAERRAADLEQRLARSDAEKRALEERLDQLARGGPARVRMGGPGGGPQVDLAGPGGARAYGVGVGGAEGPGGPAGAGGAAPQAVSIPADATADQKVDALVKAFDWDAAAAAMAKMAERRKGPGPGLGGGFGDPSVRLELSRLELALAEISRALGTSDPDAALSDPRVREALTAARLKAFGASLDARQKEQLRAEIARLRGLLAAQETAEPRTIAERALRAVREDLALEETLPSILTPEQYADWVARAGNDPFLGKPWPRMVMGVDESVDVGADLAAQWARRFQVQDGGKRALGEIARRFADGMLGVPPVPATLPAAEKRLASLRRMVRTLEVQVACERELVDEQSFTAEERARMADGLGGIFEIVRGGFHPGGGGPGEEEGGE